MKKVSLITLLAIIFGSLSTVCFLYAQDAAAWADFQQKAAAWRALATKPPLNPEADRHWILAENAFKEKNFDSAVAHYNAALVIQPMWPTGWFDLAMIYAEQKDYAKAMDSMQHYLELVPDAPDAKDARTQMIIWEDKARTLRSDAVWADPATKLMWTRKDNGSDITWYAAASYCSNLRLNDYSDWRMPTIDELQGIYDPTQRVTLSNPGCGNFQSKIKGAIALSNCIDYHNGNVLAGAVWSSSLSESQNRHPWFFPFADPNPERGHINPYRPTYMRALCVRAY
jgi:tetratricopeptide (TPR) repeat protein